MCKYEHGLTAEEFERLTLPEFEALEERRAIRLRYERFNSALVVSTLYNINRASADADPLDPFDLVPGIERDIEQEEKDKRRREIKREVTAAFLEMKGNTQDEVQAAKKAIIANLTKNGVEDPESLIEEIFPEL